MRARRSISALGGSALSLFLLSGTAVAQYEANQRAPVVRIYTETGGYVSTNYVTPSVEVGEDAYVFAVAMDLDGQIRVLHPDFPGISVRLHAYKQLHLPNFFAGYGEGSSSAFMSSSVAYSGYDSNGLIDTRGTAIALASRQPFNLERIEVDGDWNISAIRQLIENRSAPSAAQALADYLGAPGEPIGRDYLRFADARSNYYSNNYSNNYYSSCSGLSSPGLLPFAFSQLAVINRVTNLRRRGSVASVIGFDICGNPIIFFGPSRVGRFRPGAPGQQPPVNRPIGVFPPGRVPQTAGHFPGGRSRPTQQGEQKIAPSSRRAEPQPIGDVTITPPLDGRGDSRQFHGEFRPQGNGAQLPDRGGMPIDRRASPRAVPATTGMQPIREFRPEPRQAPSTSSQPFQMPERMRPSSPPPAPVIQQRVMAPPPPPPPPPPRAEPRSNPAPVTSPPSKKN
jgi:hypothetical protein